MSPPLSATLSSSLLYLTHTFVIPKMAGLGIIIGGGEGRPDGPHVIIDKILNGMDAHKVSQGQSLFISFAERPPMGTPAMNIVSCSKGGVPLAIYYSQQCLFTDV